MAKLASSEENKDILSDLLSHDIYKKLIETLYLPDISVSKMIIYLMIIAGSFVVSDANVVTVSFIAKICLVILQVVFPKVFPKLFYYYLQIFIQDCHVKNWNIYTIYIFTNFCCSLGPGLIKIYKTSKI